MPCTLYIRGHTLLLELLGPNEAKSENSETHIHKKTYDPSCLAAGHHDHDIAMRILRPERLTLLDTEKAPNIEIKGHTQKDGRMIRATLSWARRSYSSGSKNLSRIQSEFSVQAPQFEKAWDRRYKSSTEEIMLWMMDYVNPHISSKTVALDVASGTGIVARTLSPRCKKVVALDATEAMLEQGRVSAAEDGVANIDFELGDVVSMPFEDASFDFVTCRLAIHHFPHPEKAVKEMVRVCKQNGTIALIDFVTSSDSKVAQVHNDLERLRDPSHIRALSTSELIGMFEGIDGVELVRHNVRSEKGDIDAEGNPCMFNYLNLHGWMDITQTPPDAQKRILSAVHREIAFEKTVFADEETTGFDPRYDDEGENIFLEHKWVIAMGKKTK